MGKNIILKFFTSLFNSEKDKCCQHEELPVEPVIEKVETPIEKVEVEKPEVEKITDRMIDVSKTESKPVVKSKPKKKIIKSEDENPKKPKNTKLEPTDETPKVKKKVVKKSTGK